MKLTTPFASLNRKLNEMDFIRNAIKSKEKFATERLHDDGNIRYANYQSEIEMRVYLSAQGHTEIISDIV